MTAPTLQPYLLELFKALNEGEVQLTFRKLGGEITTRLATLNRGLIPDDKLPAGNKAAPDDCIAFYSLTDSDWRCFKVWNLVEFVKVNRYVEQELWVTAWEGDCLKVIDRLGHYAPMSIPEEVVSQMEFVRYSKLQNVYVYKCLVDKSWWEGNVKYYSRSVTGWSNPRRGYRSDD